MVSILSYVYASVNQYHRDFSKFFCGLLLYSQLSIAKVPKMYHKAGHG